MGFTKPTVLHIPIKRKLISTALPTLLPHKQRPTPRKNSEIRAKHETGLGYHKSNGF